MGASGHAPPQAVVAVSVIFTVVAALTVALRLWARVRVTRNSGLDDLFIGFSLLFSIATTITMCIQVHYGMGRHQRTIEPDEYMSQLKAFYVSIWVYNLSLSCTKNSILLQYLRIFPQKWFRICCYTLLGVVVVYSFYTFFTAVFACTPIRYFWDQSVGGSCLPRFAIWFANSGINIGTDILTAILPLPVLKNLELPRRQRYALMTVFALGGFTCIISILRLQGLYAVSRTQDVSWENPLAAIWSNVEIHVAIYCSCLPTLRCIFPKIFKSQLSISGRSRSGNDRSRSAATTEIEEDEEEDGRCTPKFLPRKITKLSSKITTSATATNPYGDSKSETSLEAFGRSLNSSGGGKQKSHCMGKRGSFEDIEMGRSPPRRGGLLSGGIHVTTAIEQEVERKGDSDSESTRDLVRDRGFDAV